MIDETEADLIAIVASDFGVAPPAEKLKDRLLDWLHYRGRLVSSVARVVRLSHRIQGQLANRHRVAGVDWSAVEDIVGALNAGRPVAPYLSERVRKQKDNHFADLMFNDWAVSHFHPRNLSASGVSDRGDALLFVHIDDCSATVLDVGSHSQWADTKLLEVLREERPALFGGLELIGIAHGDGEYTSDERQGLRRAGLATTVQLGGKVYMPPGFGVATSGHGARFSMFLTAMHDVYCRVFAQLQERSCASNAGGNLATSIRLGYRFDGSRLHLIDKNSSAPFWSSQVIY